MTNQIDEQPVACHLFENTIQMSLKADMTFSGLEKGIMPCQIMYVCLLSLMQEYRKLIRTSLAMQLCPEGEEVRQLPLRPRVGGEHWLIDCSTCSAKKINSHRWALEAFAPQLDPRVVILLDVGTKPANGSLYSLWKQFDVRQLRFDMRPPGTDFALLDADELERWRSVRRDRRHEGQVVAGPAQPAHCRPKFRVQDLEYVAGASTSWSRC